MKLKDLLTYADQIDAFLGVFKRLKALKGTPVGETGEIPRVVTKVGAQEWEIPAHPARRLR
jgi:hypothetical protein